MVASIGSAGKAMARPWSCRGRGQRRPGLVAGVFGVAVALALALAACTSAQPSSSAAAGGSQPAAPPGMSCAWPTELTRRRTTQRSLDVGDSAEAVWFQPIVAAAGTRIVLSGRFPDARYASFRSTRLAAALSPAAGTSLPDYRIAPQPGSVNPWQQQGAPGGRFTVTIRPDPAPGQANTLPLPAGTTSQHPGYLVYRVYLPAGGSFSAVPVPVLTVEQGGAARTLPACPQHNATCPVRGSGCPLAGLHAGRHIAVRSAAPPQLEFFAPPRARCNNGGARQRRHRLRLAYLVRPPAPDVVVVTAKAPTFAPGSHPSPWPAPGEDVRYWSMCIGVLPPTSDRRQQAARGRHRLRVPRRRGHQAERGRGLHLRDRQRIAAGCHQPRPRRHLPALLHRPADRPVPPGPAEHAGQHVIRALARGRHAGRRPGGGRGRHGPVLSARCGLPAGDPHGQGPAGLPVKRGSGHS